MRIDIHDIGHGACAVITCPNGAQVMLDCGYCLDKAWFPSVTYAGQHFALLAFTNLDEDHVGDLPYLCDKISIGSVFSNPTVTAAALAMMKRAGGMGVGVTAAHAILTRFGSGLIGNPADLGDVRITAYWNRYDLDSVDTNNLSPAFFVRYRGFTMLFAGDLETAGWKALLRIPGFAQELDTVNIMLASHHGRANGCCDEVFRLMRPDIVVFSDDAKQHESQETDAWYRRRVNGLPDFDSSPYPSGYARRHVMTTRRDGSLAIRVGEAGGYLITPDRRTTPAAVPWLQALTIEHHRRS